MNDVCSFLWQYFAIPNSGNATNECAKERHTLSIAKIWPKLRDIMETVRDEMYRKLLLFTNVKSHTSFRMILKW